jgi:signal transduction histidine kinase
VGGDIFNCLEQGNVAGGMALRLLKGEKPQNIPPVTETTIYTFDWRALKRWGLKESDLPPGSRLLFREISVWERTKRIWISGILIILSLSLVAIYLQRSRAELKESRDAQLQLSGLLINAQENERSRLASELHDDFSQRLALLAFGLGGAVEMIPGPPDTLKQKLEDLMDSTRELGGDLHTVSHRLHSSTLDALGLVPGLTALCKEFAARQDIEIGFTSDNVPRAVHADVALCLFRIAQEGLQNVKKHSGAKKAQVSLTNLGDKLLLSLSDEGNGFNLTMMGSGNGLGLRSMQERARLLGGEFEIYSKPGEGTKIKAWVPAQPGTD